MDAAKVLAQVKLEQHPPVPANLDQSPVCDRFLNMGTSQTDSPRGTAVTPVQSADDGCSQPEKECVEP